MPKISSWYTIEINNQTQFLNFKFGAMSLTVDRRNFLYIGALLAGGLVDPQALFAGAASPNAPPFYKVKEKIIHDASDPIYSAYSAYYTVKHRGDGAYFAIAQRRDCRVDNAFYYACRMEDKKKGLIFPPSASKDKPVALVDASEAGLSGAFEIFETPNEYKVTYKFSPLLKVPSHTTVSSDYLLAVDRALKRMPAKLTEFLNKQSSEVMLARNVSDSYYWLYPDMKTSDEARAVAPDKPVLEKVDGKWVDNRKRINTPGICFGKKVVMPQQYIKYGTTEISDRISVLDHVEETTFHEIGHAFDFSYSPRWSDYKDFTAGHKNDLSKISPEDEKLVAYFVMSGAETFAELLGALLGGFSPQRAAKILTYFPECAEYVRRTVLPQFGYEITPEFVRENIYPSYLSDNKVAKAQMREMYKLNPELLKTDACLCC